MKHLKRYNEKVDYDKIQSKRSMISNPEWDQFVKDLFEKFLTIYDEDDGWDSGLEPSRVMHFFEDLNTEFEESQDIDVWAVEWNPYEKNPNEDNLIGLSKAYGPLHAQLKLAIEFKNQEIIDSVVIECFVPEDEDIEENINKAKKLVEKWTKIY